uniref:CSON008122 protein n=1 Tax=Culicoides sonorensis TaxID=179676 RepID=A0A336N786_CULSO
MSLYASSADLDVTDDGESSSLCNGDENHKVWTGSQDHLDAIHSESPYEIYSGGHSTLGRPARQRQISMPVQPPPPPKEELKKKKESKQSKPVGSQSLSGTLIRPRPIHMNPAVHMGNRGPMPPHPGMMIYGPPMMPPHQSRQFHTIGHRGHPNNGQGHPQMHQMHHPQMPLPMPIMMPQQYATLQKSRTGKKKKKDKMNGIPVPVPMPVPPIFYPPGPPHHLVDSRPLSMSNRKLAQSAGNGLDDSGGTTSGADSPNGTGTGIYRRKGHLNERAFSYSIRQEHRSRSHGSLASLQFSPPDIKKEREIAQMVAALDISDERNGDDATLTRRGQMTNGHHHGMNGHHREMNGHHREMNGHHMNGHHMNGHGTFGKPRR